MAVVAMFALSASSASAIFTSDLTENTGTGTSTADVFDAFGSTVTCTNNTFHVGKYNTTKVGEPGVHVEAHFPTETLTVAPKYSSCTAFGLPATVDFTGCDFVFHTPVGGPLTVSLVCPQGVTGVDITIYSSAAHTTAVCHVVVHPFASKGGLTATNSGKHVLIKGTVENITATQERTSIACPPGTHTATAKYTVQAAGITIAGTPGSTISVS